MTYGPGLWVCETTDEAINKATYRQLIGGTAPPTSPPPPPPPPPSATVPGQLQSLTLAAASGQITATWVAPVSNGGSPITAYVLNVQPGNQVIEVTDTTLRSRAITGLTDGTLYTVTAWARNQVGNGQTRTAQATPTSLIPPLAGWPNASNTGVPAGTVLTNSGSVRATTAGQVISKLNITGQISIEAPNVIIDRCRLTVPSTLTGVHRREGGSYTIYDSEIIGGQNGLGFQSYKAYRCNIHRQVQDGCKVGDDTIVEDCYIHGPLPERLASGEWAHGDSIQMQGGSRNLIIRHNNIVCLPEGYTGTGGSALPGGHQSAIILKPDFGAGSGPILVENNRLAGGNYTFYFVEGSSGDRQTGAVFKDNRFVKMPAPRFGPVLINMPGYTSSGNRYEDGTLVPGGLS